MIYELAFLEVSLKEWEKLDRNIQAQFKKARRTPTRAARQIG
jgi:mRNA-degrading endonuclease RelE of RelBE toxin-antitoxin system